MFLIRKNWSFNRLSIFLNRSLAGRVWVFATRRSPFLLQNNPRLGRQERTKRTSSCTGPQSWTGGKNQRPWSRNRGNRIESRLRESRERGCQSSVELSPLRYPARRVRACWLRVFASRSRTGNRERDSGWESGGREDAATRTERWSHSLGWPGREVFQGEERWRSQNQERGGEGFQRGDQVGECDNPAVFSPCHMDGGRGVVVLNLTGNQQPLYLVYTNDRFYLNVRKYTPIMAEDPASECFMAPQQSRIRLVAPSNLQAHSLNELPILKQYQRACPRPLPEYLDLEVSKSIP